MFHKYGTKNCAPLKTTKSNKNTFGKNKRIPLHMSKQNQILNGEKCDQKEKHSLVPDWVQGSGWPGSGGWSSWGCRPACSPWWRSAASPPGNASRTAGGWYYNRKIYRPLKAEFRIPLFEPPTFSNFCVPPKLPCLWGVHNLKALENPGGALFWTGALIENLPKIETFALSIERIRRTEPFSRLFLVLLRQRHTKKGWRYFFPQMRRFPGMYRPPGGADEGLDQTKKETTTLSGTHVTRKKYK